MKKPVDQIHNLAIEFVEFDDKDQPMSPSFTPRLVFICIKEHSIARKNMR